MNAALNAAMGVQAIGSDVAEKPKKAPRAPVLDATKPIELDSWFVPEMNAALFIANEVRRQIVRDADFSTGHRVSGYVDRITLYPNGVVVCTILRGWRRGMPAETKADAVAQYLVFAPSGHGEVMP